MKIKKILAGVAAVSLATSALAASAFATDYPVKATTESYQYNVEYAAEIGADVTVDTLAVALTSGWNDNTGWNMIFTSKLVVEYFDNSNAAKKYEASLADTWDGGSYSIPVSSTVGFNGITNRKSGTPMKVTLTGSLQTGQKDAYKKDATVSGASVTLNGDALTGKITSDVKVVTTDGVPTSPLNLGGYKKAELRDMAKGASIEFTFEKDPAVVGYVSVTFANGANGAASTTVNGIIANKKATVAIPEGFSYVVEDEDPSYAGVGSTIAYTVNAVDAEGKTIDIKTITIKTGSAPAETTAAETTGADVKPADTTAAGQTPADTTAAGGNTNQPGGDDKNQPTGFAIAVIPAVVSAAGAIIAKKRK